MRVMLRISTKNYIMLEKALVFKDPPQERG